LLSAGSRNFLPDSKQTDEWIGGELSEKKLRQEVKIGDEGGLEDDRDVGRVEKLDGISSSSAALFGIFDWDIDSETLEIDYNDEDKNGRQKICDVREILSIEGFFQGSDLVVFGDQKLNERDESAFKFSSSTRVYCCGT